MVNFSSQTNYISFPEGIKELNHKGLDSFASCLRAPGCCKAPLVGAAQGDHVSVTSLRAECVPKYPAWWTNSLQLKMAIEIVDFPIKNGDFPWQNVSSPEGMWLVSLQIVKIGKFGLRGVYCQDLYAELTTSEVAVWWSNAPVCLFPRIGLKERLPENQTIFGA